MNTNALISLAPKLAAAVLSGDQKAALILAADTKAACEEEQTFAPWTPHNPRGAK